MEDFIIEPIEIFTSIINIEGLQDINLSFLITRESGEYYIQCLDFNIMSCGKTIEECKENIQEAILIYLEDIEEGDNIFDPAKEKYWKMFYNLKRKIECKKVKKLLKKEKEKLLLIQYTKNLQILKYADIKICLN